jgi:hypothetical protein
MPGIPRLLYKKKAKKKVKIPVSSLLFFTWLITEAGAVGCRQDSLDTFFKFTCLVKERNVEKKTIKHNCLWTKVNC